MFVVSENRRIALVSLLFVPRGPPGVKLKLVESHRLHPYHTAFDRNLVTERPKELRLNVYFTALLNRKCDNSRASCVTLVGD